MNLTLLLGIAGIAMGVVGLWLTIRGWRDLRRTSLTDTLELLREAFDDVRDSAAEWPSKGDRTAYIHRYDAALESLRRFAQDASTPPSVARRIGDLPDGKQLANETGYILFSRVQRLCMESDGILAALGRPGLWKGDRDSLWHKGEWSSDRRPLGERWRLFRHQMTIRVADWRRK
jgi:hypothetical protein